MSPEEETIINRNTMKLQEHLYKAIKQRDQYKAERDTLIDDIAVLKANISRLERENRFLLSRKDNLFDSWRDENKRSVALSKRLEQLKRENNNLKQSVSEYKDYAESHAASYLEFKSLEHENKRLTRLTRKLTTHRTMWGSLKDWRRDMLEIDKNDTQLIGLGLVMDDLEKRHLYKEDE